MGLMNWTQLQQFVYTETARPDLVAETNSALWAALQKYHGKEFFYRDLSISQYIFDISTQFIQSIDLAALPNYRALHSIRKWDSSLEQYEMNPTLLPPLMSNSLGVPVNPDLALAFLKILTPDDILDNFATEKVDVCYLAGSSIAIKSSTQLSQAIVNYYAWPFITASAGADGYVNASSWIMDKYPFLLVYDAASAILQKIGMTDAARKYDTVDPATGRQSGLVDQQWQAVIAAEITGKGY